MNALSLSLFLIAYNVGIKSLPSRYRDMIYVPANTLVTLLLLYWSVRAQGMSFEDIGINIHTAKSGLKLGSALGIAVGLPILTVSLVMNRQAIERISIECRPTSIGNVIYRIMIHIPLGTVFIEEVVFRGLLLHMLRVKGIGRRNCVLLSSMLYSLWHIGLLPREFAAGRLNSFRAVMGAVATLPVTFVGGMIFGAVRFRTSNLLGPMSAHYLINALGSLGLFLRLRR
jgi:uncharacterized protein